MRTAREIMHTPAPSVGPDVTAKELHEVLLSRGLDGICVVEDGRLLGVVTSMDLVFRQKRVHLPTFFAFLEAVIPLENPFRSAEEVHKIAATRVGDLATRDVVTVGPDTAVDELATLMVEQHLSVLPVLDGDRLIGMVTKEDVLRAAFA